MSESLDTSKTESLLRKLLQVLSTDHIGIGNQSLTVTYSSVVQLTVPTGARYALITIEATDPSLFASSLRIVRFWEDGTSPTNTTGIPRGHLETFTVSELENLQRLKIKKIENVGTVTANIQYYS